MSLDTYSVHVYVCLLEVTKQSSFLVHLECFV